MKAIAVYLNEAEMLDFEMLKSSFERRSNCDTVRAMISFCKKNLDKNIRVANKAQEAQHDGN